MKAFRYSLQAVLTLRQRAERAAMENYALTLLTRRQVGEALDAVNRELSAVWLRCSQGMMDGCPAGELMHLHLHRRRLDAERVRREASVAEAERAMGQAFGALLAARQARELVDQHRAAQHAVHAQALNRAEQKFLDDLGGQRAAAPQSWLADCAN